MKRNNELGKSIREFIVANPEADTAAVMKATGCRNPKQVYQARTYAKANGLLKQAAARAQAIIGEPMQLETAVPASGIRLKLREGKRMIGTLGISHDGVKFIPANGKKVPVATLKWQMLKLLSGLEVG